MSNTPADIQAAALLAEPVRGDLYRWVVGAGRPVGRDEAAAAVDVSRALAAFHLDRLVQAGLLVAEFRRLTDRSGPGAGRPAKLYRRGPREVVISLPGRRYDLAARLMAQTIEQLGEPPVGEQPLDALRANAREVGALTGATVRRQAGRRPSQIRLHAAVFEALAASGYQPYEAAGELQLGNCPFERLVDEHRELVCGMNLAMAEGLVGAVGGGHTAVRFDPQPGQCCVAIRRAAS